jgi:hypothetical protein
VIADDCPIQALQAQVTAREEKIAAMLLKKHKKVEQLEATIAQERKDSQSTAAEQQKEIQTRTASLKRTQTTLAWRCRRYS